MKKEVHWLLAALGVLLMISIPALLWFGRVPASNVAALLAVSVMNALLGLYLVFLAGRLRGTGCPLVLKDLRGGTTYTVVWTADAPSRVGVADGGNSTGFETLLRLSGGAISLFLNETGAPMRVGATYEVHYDGKVPSATLVG